MMFIEDDIDQLWKEEPRADDEIKAPMELDDLPPKRKRQMSEAGRKALQANLAKAREKLKEIRGPSIPGAEIKRYPQKKRERAMEMYKETVNAEVQKILKQKEQETEMEEFRKWKSGTLQVPPQHPISSAAPQPSPNPPLQASPEPPKRKPRAKTKPKPKPKRQSDPTYHPAWFNIDQFLG